MAVTGTLSATVLSAGTLNGITSVDVTTEDAIEALIFSPDSDAETIDANWTFTANPKLNDNVSLALGTASDFKLFWDDTNNDQLLITSTKNKALAATDPMIEILVDSATPNGTAMIADADVFSIAKGTAASNIDLFNIDEDGDVVILGTLSATAFSPDNTGYDTVKEEDTPLTQRANLNFIGDSITCVDDAVDTTDCTITDTVFSPTAGLSTDHGATAVGDTDIAVGAVDLDSSEVAGILPNTLGGTGDNTSAVTGVPEITGGNWTYTAASTDLSDISGTLIDHSALVGTGADTAAWTAAIPDCNTENHLTFTQDGNTWGCEADDGAGGGTTIQVDGVGGEATMNIVSADSTGIDINLDTVATPDEIEINLDLTEINSTVFGSGTFTTLDFDAGATDPRFTFASDSVTITNAATFNHVDNSIPVADLNSTVDQAELDALSGTNTGDEVAADLTTAGVIEIATGAETNTGTDATRAVSPDGLDDWTGSAQITTVGTIASPTFTGSITVGTTNPADAGAVRLENATAIGWEAAPAGTDVTLSVDSNETLTLTSGVGGIALVTTTATECVMLNAAGINCATTTGCNTVDIPATGFDYTVAAFEGTTDSDEDGAWTFPVPKNIASTTFVASYYWTTPTCTASSNDDVCFAVQSAGVANDGLFNTLTFGTAEGETDTCTTANDIYMSEDFTVTHGWAEDEMAVVKIYRDNTAAFPTGCTADDILGDARLIALRVCYETNNVFSGE
jgi:hypothetical protein